LMLRCTSSISLVMLPELSITMMMSTGRLTTLASASDMAHTPPVEGLGGGMVAGMAMQRPSIQQRLPAGHGQSETHFPLLPQYEPLPQPRSAVQGQPLAAPIRAHVSGFPLVPPVAPVLPVLPDPGAAPVPPVPGRPPVVVTVGPPQPMLRRTKTSNEWVDADTTDVMNTPKQTLCQFVVRWDD
jgi:hypothetical protein